MASDQVRVLTLNRNENGESILYRLQIGWTLQFRLGPTLLGQSIELFTNHPEKEDDEFQREKYQKLEWSWDSKNKRDDTSAHADLVIKQAGSFSYRFNIVSNGENGGSGYFLVDPILEYGPNKNEVLPLDCIQCQTILAKNLGPFNTWESKLRVAKESGYNMLHFTPVQPLGASKSAYSLADQVTLNPNFGTVSWEDLEAFTRKMREEWNMLSICDIVLNHTANETEWLQQYPDATYNCKNSPHLRPAYMLDRALYHLSLDVAEGKWVAKGIPKGEISTGEHLQTARSLLYEQYLPIVNIHEYFLLDTADVLEQFEKKILASDPPANYDPASNEQLKIIQDPKYRRLKSTIDLDIALKLYNVQRYDCGGNEERRILLCCSELKKKLDELNHNAYNTAWRHINAGVENVLKGASWQRLADDGPKLKKCDNDHPLICEYFKSPTATLKEEEKMMFSHGEKMMAHNGWVMDHDPLVNFALPGSNVYLRRELIAWGDSVKLRFGEKPEDSPFLWDYFKQYAEHTAKAFHGIRLDNCHSTPIHVAEYLLDAARRVRPNLYVIAELFTTSEAKDNIFINRLGISSLIREALSAWDSHEEGRLVYRYGGEPVGSFIQPKLRPLMPSIAHALFYDQTHDNMSPVQKRSVFDVLPTTALVAMACCGTASNRGYDELVPKHIHVVNETRTYQPWTENHQPGQPAANNKTGIIAAKKALNDLHFELGKNGFNEVYVDQMDFDCVAVTRHNPRNHETVVLVAHTAFSYPHDPAAKRHLKHIQVEGILSEIVLEARFVRDADEKSFKEDEEFINGYTMFSVELKQHIYLPDSSIAKAVPHDNPAMTEIKLANFTPGSVIAFKFKLHPEQAYATVQLSHLINSFCPQIHPNEVPVTNPAKDLNEIISKLNLADLNRVLFRCAQEEGDEDGCGVYVLNGYGPLVYAGLQGVMSILSEIRPRNDLGNWLPGNLREGNWLMDYIIGRLKRDESTKPLGIWFETTAFEPMKKVPRYLIPRYFDAIITGTYITLLHQVWNLMSPFVKDGSSFVKALALGSVQHGAIIRSAPLPTLSPNLESAPPIVDGVQKTVTCAAGLPHFSTGYMRNWGRDTFITMRGLFIIPGRYLEARNIILGFGACLRHGLIPNLLDGGKNARFNCRDAYWWWLHCIKSYVEEAPEGDMIFKDKVSRLFPKDDSPHTAPGEYDQPLQDVIQEGLQKHFNGLKFRERNAGKRIDEHMKDEGFNNEIGVDLSTGFVFGGNPDNCGTWMDKMGSSEKAGIKGRPATPRDGSAVELVGLSYACLEWLARMNKEGRYCYKAVERFCPNGELIKWTFAEWATEIKENFERHFFVPPNKDSPVERRRDLINKTNIYKDTLNSAIPWTDYQLRCNFPIAIAVAPDIVNPENAWAALQVVKKKLLGPLGLATLDPDDWNYRPNYDNSNDSHDDHVAHGFNYHQGPEWVWPVGYFLRAYLLIAQRSGGPDRLAEARDFVKSVLSAHFIEVQSSRWRGIPELTNQKGNFCPGSNPIQAWSMGCLLEVLHLMQEM